SCSATCWVPRSSTWPASSKGPPPAPTVSRSRRARKSPRRRTLPGGVSPDESSEEERSAGERKAIWVEQPNGERYPLPTSGQHQPADRTWGYSRDQKRHDRSQAADDQPTDGEQFPHEHGSVLARLTAPQAAPWR